MQELLQMLKFVQQQSDDENVQAEMLSVLLEEPPPEDFNPKVKLPTENELPAFSLKQPGVGGDLAGLDFGLAAPLFGEKGGGPPGLGELLIGEIDG
jgi:hypothetical protein